jgi:hypothetical protein
MKKLVYGFAALALAAGVSAPAMAETVVIHHGPVMHHHRWVTVCHVEHHHHRTVRVCHRVRR